MPVGGFFSGGGFSGSSRLASGGGGSGAPSSASSWGTDWGQTTATPRPTPPSPVSPAQRLAEPFRLGQMNPANHPDLYNTYLQQQGNGFAEKIATTQFGPQQEMIDQAQAMNGTRLGLVGADVEYQKMAATRDAGLARRKLELERGLANGQIGNIDKLRALAGEQLANQKADFANSRNKTHDMAKRNQWDLESNLTQRGAFNTIANERGTGRINADLMYSIGAINNQEEDANISYRQGQIGYDNQALALRNRLAGIGLDAEGVANSLENALQQIGLGGFTDILSLIEGSNSLSAQEAALSGQVLQQVATLSGLPLDILQQLAGSGSSTPQPTARSRFLAKRLR